MPKVDGKQFGYGPKGKKAAKAYAKKMGKKVSKKKNPGYYVESFAASLKERIDALFEGRREMKKNRPNPHASAAAKESGDPEAHGKRYTHIPKGSKLAPRKEVPAKVEGEDYATTLRKRAEKAGKAGRKPRG